MCTHLNSCQHGFISGKSCVTNLLETLDQIGRQLDGGGQTDVVYLDMSKAFDKVNHDLLIHRLRYYGLAGNLLDWFRSYLTDRHQRVTVLGATSDTLPVTSGVPQGSILGPALFLFFVNDIPDIVTKSKVAMFADDTKLFKEIKTSDDTLALQEDLSNLESWSIASGLSFNASKCHSQLVSRKTKPIINVYHMNGAPLDSINCERDLGVWVSSNLTWNRQVLEQYSRANKVLGYVRRNSRDIKSFSIRKQIYLTLVRPHLGYATQIWGPQSVQLILKLERIQRRATKYMLCLPFSCSESYVTRLQSLQLLPPSYWHEYLDMTLFFKLTHGMLSVDPSIVPVMRNTRSTRSSSNGSITKYGHQSVKQQHINAHLL